MSAAFFRTLRRFISGPRTGENNDLFVSGSHTSENNFVSGPQTTEINVRLVSLTHGLKLTPPHCTLSRSEICCSHGL